MYLKYFPISLRVLDLALYFRVYSLLFHLQNIFLNYMYIFIFYFKKLYFKSWENSFAPPPPLWVEKSCQERFFKYLREFLSDFNAYTLLFLGFV